MADIYEISKATSVPLKTLRRIEAAGFLKVSKKVPLEDGIRKSLAKQHQLTVLQLLGLAKNLDLCEKLDCDDAVTALGEIRDGAAPWNPIGARLTLAASKNLEAIETVAQWVKSELDTLRPGVEVPYAWLGVRMLWNVPDAVLKETSASLRNTMWNVRSHPILAGYSRADESGKILYSRKISLDL